MAFNPEITEGEVKRKYEVTIEAEGADIRNPRFTLHSADGLNTDAGTQVTFVWKRSGKISLSESAEVWDDGVTYWDSKCTQICTTRQDDEGSWTSKPSQFLVQALPVDEEGIPCGIGATIGSATFDLAPYCSHDDEYIDNNPPEPHHVVLPLEPSGSISLYISSRFLPYDSSDNDDTDSSTDDDQLNINNIDATSSSFAPSPSTLSLVHQDDSTLSFDYDNNNNTNNNHHLCITTDDCNDDTTILHGNISSPRLPPPLSLIPSGDMTEFVTPVRSTAVHGDASSDDGVLDRTTSSTATASTTASDGSSGGRVDVSAVESVHALQRRCRRLAKERDEARAEAFAEASVAVQRGIEIENLRRAKDMLLQRLESTEQQLVMMMRLDNDSPSSTSTTTTTINTTNTMNATTNNNSNATTTTTAPQQQQSSSGYGSQSEIVHALVEAKVSLAEKEFEIMELSGQLRAREVHIEALSEHLAAVRMRAEREALTSPAASMSIAKGNTMHQLKQYSNGGGGSNTNNSSGGGGSSSKSPVMLITEPFKAAAEKVSKSMIKVGGSGNSGNTTNNSSSGNDTTTTTNTTNNTNSNNNGSALRIVVGNGDEERKLSRSNSPVVHIVANASSTRQHVVAL